jgi:hypothetical protein
MTKPISKKPHAHASTPSTEPDTRQTPGTEIYREIRESLNEFQINISFGRLDGRPDLVMKAFRQLNDLNGQAYDAFLELNPEMRQNTHASTQSAGQDAFMRGRRNRRLRRQQGVRDAEIYVDIGKSLGKFQMDVLSGRWDGYSDRVLEAFDQLRDLNTLAYYAFLALNRKMRLQAHRDELWNRDAKK